jgi:hypothetical protein
MLKIFFIIVLVFQVQIKAQSYQILIINTVLMTTRKLIVCAIASLFAVKSFSQSDEKKTRFGIVLTPQLDWLRTGNAKEYTGNGVAAKFGLGLSMEFKINDVVHFLTGIGGVFGGGTENYNVGSTPIGYYADNSLNPVKISDLNNELNQNAASQTAYFNGHQSYKLLTRDYKTTYVTIPLALKMMTKEIGALKYFGIFGGNVEFLTGATATDQIVNTTTNVTSTNTGIDVKSDCEFFKVGLNIGAGAEYTLSGTTAITFGLNYYRGFTSLTSSSSGYLITGNSNFNGSPQSSFSPVNNTGGFTSLKHSIYGDGIALTVGILF